MMESWTLKPEKSPGGWTCVAASCLTAPCPRCWGHGYPSSSMRVLDQDRSGQRNTAGLWPQWGRHLLPPCSRQPRPQFGEEEVTLPSSRCDHGPWPSRSQHTRTSRQSRASVFYKLFYRCRTHVLSEIYKIKHLCDLWGPASWVWGCLPRQGGRQGGHHRQLRLGAQCVHKLGLFSRSGNKRPIEIAKQPGNVI